jgi:hypothetical protein
MQGLWAIFGPQRLKEWASKKFSPCFFLANLAMMGHFPITLFVIGPAKLSKLIFFGLLYLKFCPLVKKVGHPIDRRNY